MVATLKSAAGRRITMRLWIAVLVGLVSAGAGAASRRPPDNEAEIAALQVRVADANVSVADAKRAVSELREDLVAQRKRAADAEKTAAAQLDKRQEEMAAESASTTRPTTTGPTLPSSTPRAGAVSLPASATCGQYLDASSAARATATRAALVTARRAAGGVSADPPDETRARFEIVVGLLCEENRGESMLQAMASVIASGGSTYVG